MINSFSHICADEIEGCRRSKLKFLLPSPTAFADVFTKANISCRLHGILVQLPLPPHISEHAITTSVSEYKDVDGFGVESIGELAKKGGKPLFTPCTPKGVMILLQEAGVNLHGKNAVVLGRSDIVGSPVSYLLRNADATVTVCHSKTNDLPSVIRTADVLNTENGKPQIIKV